MTGIRGHDCFDPDLVVAHHFHLGLEFAEILHQVIGKRIIVVDHQDFHDSAPDSASAQGSRDGNPASASATARNIARPLFMVSAHSFAGTES